MPAELHIASLAVQALPARLDAVRRAIEALGGAEVHASDPAGKLVVVLETEDANVVVERLAAIRNIDGVLAAHLVFHRIIADTAAEAAP